MGIHPKFRGGELLGLRTNTEQVVLKTFIVLF